MPSGPAIAVLGPAFQESVHIERQLLEDPQHVSLLSHQDGNEVFQLRLVWVRPGQQHLDELPEQRQGLPLLLADNGDLVRHVRGGPPGRRRLIRATGSLRFPLGGPPSVSKASVNESSANGGEERELGDHAPPAHRFPRRKVDRPDNAWAIRERVLRDTYET